MLIDTINTNIYSFNEALAYSEVAWNNILIQSMNEEYSECLNEATKVTESIKNFFKNVIEWFKKVLEKVLNFFKNVVNRIVLVFRKLLNFVKINKNKINKGAEYAQSIHDSDEDDKEINKYITVKRNRVIIFQVANLKFKVSSLEKIIPMYYNGSRERFAKISEYLKGNKYFSSINDYYKDANISENGVDDSYLDLTINEINRISDWYNGTKKLKPKEAVSFADELCNVYQNTYEKIIAGKDDEFKTISNNCQKEAKKYLAEIGDRMEQTDEEIERRRHGVVCLTAAKQEYSYVTKITSKFSSFFNNYVLSVVHAIYKECLAYYNSINK